MWAGKRFVGTEDNWSFGYDLGDDRVPSDEPGRPGVAAQRRQGGSGGDAGPAPVTAWSASPGRACERRAGSLTNIDLPRAHLCAVAGQDGRASRGLRHLLPSSDGTRRSQADPQFLYINDWNEWTAGKYHPAEGGTIPVHAARQPVLFRRPVQCRVQPHDSADERRLHRQLLHADGAEHPAIQGRSPDSRELRGLHSINIDGDFADWAAIEVEYRDTVGDTVHRDYAGLRRPALHERLGPQRHRHLQSCRGQRHASISTPRPTSRSPRTPARTGCCC